MNRTNVTYPKVVQLSFLNLTTSCDISNYNKTCGYDWVEIRSVSNQLDIGGPRYCCSSIPTEIFFSNNEILIFYYSTFQQAQTKNGFAARIKSTISKK